ncbi:hypothetical protein SUGI_0922450 [Cryptomeria japonica]|uniref:S-adenosylmethionine decarboxylase proenzyme n=1 Tax=Cryptomeria japonica TaxID=3369 RepID=UPI0024149C00|nr:S-adenosylmethionine decarboxylase proenzyme [Cryptomeria japonica]XP_057873565.2 S-adenosylmethionine decarboxylase proenzyme [Cryptomeria japonica]GLJ44193.1 hypothetical protein SUGI_0922450 [Cryptomeria japonica]
MGCDEIEAGACPGFEGFEKRLEIEFTCCERPEQSGVKVNKKTWLRSLAVSALEEILSAAQCSIVSGLSNPELDSYVLSESSLFVYPLKIIIKTCGTTQLLNAIPALLNHASGLSLAVCGCRYSRGAFLFPQAQSFPHTDFREEVLFLDNYFGGLGSGSKAYKLMDGIWHIYSAQALPLPCNSIPSSSSYTLEVCMTQIDASFASLFFKENGLQTAREMSVSSGIANILEDFEVCDYAFDPCGYSMNAINGDAYSTIHITPEENCSYASFEIMETTTLDCLQALTYKIASAFRPGTLSFSLYQYTHDQEEEVSKAFHLYGYECTEPIHKTLPGGGMLLFFSFTRIAKVLNTIKLK